MVPGRWVKSIKFLSINDFPWCLGYDHGKECLLNNQSSPFFLRVAWRAILAFLILGIAQIS